MSTATTASGRSALAAPVAVLLAAVVATTVVALVDPEEPGHYPSCPLLSLTGWYCPGCGSLRALHAMAHGDLGTAVARNVLAVLAVPLLLMIWVRWVLRLRAGTGRRWVAPPRSLYALAAVVMVYGVLRNAPVTGWLAP